MYSLDVLLSQFGNRFVVPCLVLTVASWSAYRFLRRQVRWSVIHLFKYFPQFAVIPTARGFSVINKEEVYGFLEFSWFSMIQQMLANWSVVPLPFVNPVWASRSSRFTYCWNLACKILSITLLACEMNAIMW